MDDNNWSVCDIKCSNVVRNQFTQQYDDKIRKGIKPVFRELVRRPNCYDTESLERVICALAKLDQ